MIVIYTPKVTNRIKYVFDFVFSQYFGIEYIITENSTLEDYADFCCINYSNQTIPNSISIFQADLLLENTIKTQRLFVSRESALPVFFQTTEFYHIRFDIFASIFYLISRYEEYTLHEPDEHGRFLSKNSILAKPAFSFLPIVEIWLAYFKNELLKIYPTLPFKKRDFQFICTFDVDNAFKYKGRDWRKHLPNFRKIDAWKTIFQNKKDPFDMFDFLLSYTQSNHINTLIFFLLNDDDPNNSKVSPSSKIYWQLIQRISKKANQIGIHPSYNSQSRNLILNEKNVLSSIVQQPIQISRQHFLKLKFPDTYRQVLSAQIGMDYSLAYPDVVGFRAGCSHPFYFFDLEKNETSDLLVQPSCYMDATFAYYQNKSLDAIKVEFLFWYHQVQKINGNFVSIFHNDLLVQPSNYELFNFIIQHHIVNNSQK